MGGFCPGRYRHLDSIPDLHPHEARSSTQTTKDVSGPCPMSSACKALGGATTSPRRWRSLWSPRHAASPTPAQTPTCPCFAWLLLLPRPLLCPPLPGKFPTAVMSHRPGGSVSKDAGSASALRDVPTALLCPPAPAHALHNGAVYDTAVQASLQPERDIPCPLRQIFSAWTPFSGGLSFFFFF